MLKKIIAVMLAAVCLITVVSIPASSETKGEMRNITTMELVREMGIGINLGNTMESCGDWIAQWGDGTVKSYETAWGSPVITKEIIRGYADEGFGVLRIPVAWSNLMGDNYTISKDYMARVEEIVDWTLEAGMYAIVNIHYDGGWVNTFPENKEECMKRFTRFWEQISENFKNYGDKLMFEAQNEEFGWNSLYNEWDPSTYETRGESYALVNEINQKFVDIVRSAGGNNPKRHLLISGYNTDIDKTCDPLFKMPNDPANRCAVSVHYYTPVLFCILEEDADWGKARSTWGTDADYNELYTQLDKMKTNFIDKGIPVIIGEYGCPTKNKETESVVEFISSVCKEAYDRQLCPVLWDVTGGHYDRTTCKMNNRELQKLMAAVPEDVTSATVEQINNFVERLYTIMLKRASEPEGKKNHVDGLLSGKTAAEVAESFVLGEELKVWKISNEEFVRRMYLTFLDREADPEGLAVWTSVLDKGCSYGRMFRDFCNSAEFKIVCDSYGIKQGSFEVTEYRDINENITHYCSRMYTKALGRAYDVDGLNIWTEALINGTETPESIAVTFLDGDEFRMWNHSDEVFVDRLYETLFNRPADAEGKQTWLNLLALGTSRKTAIETFVQSPEFILLKQSLGL